MPVLEKKKIVENNGVGENVSNVIKDFDSVVAKKSTKNKSDALLTIRATQAKRATYKAFFASKNLSLSKGVQIAVDYLIEQVENGKIKLKDTGVYPL